MAELQQRMDSHEFIEWIAYDRLDPIGTVRDDLNFALLTSRLINFFAHVYKKEGTTPRTLDYKELMPEFGTPRKPLTPEELYAKARGAFAIYQRQS